MIDTPLPCLRVPEHVVSAWHVELLFRCEDATGLPVMFLSSFLAIVVLALTILALAILVTVVATAVYAGVVEPDRY